MTSLEERLPAPKVEDILVLYNQLVGNEKVRELPQEDRALFLDQCVKILLREDRSNVIAALFALQFRGQKKDVGLQ